MRLGVNIDHVATVRQARGGVEPSPLEASRVVEAAGADGITVHIRMDRRHIQEHDIDSIRAENRLPLNIEMAATDEMLGLARRFKPHKVTLVPEFPGEITTTGGLDCIAAASGIQRFVTMGRETGISVAVFIDPDERQIEHAARLGVGEIEIHTGEYAKHFPDRGVHLEAVRAAAAGAKRLGLIVAAGHGLTVPNVSEMIRIPAIEELNIGHHIVSRALFVGLERAIREMLAAMRK